MGQKKKKKAVESHSPAPTTPGSAPRSKVGPLIILLVLAAGAIVPLAIYLSKESAPTSPSVLIISVDTLRPDHLSCYGYPRNTSPRLDEFAEKAMLFENVVTPRPKTAPSLISMLTGYYPHTHGIRTNFKPLPGVELRVDPEKLFRPESTGPGTLAELLSGKGYSTAAFVSNFVLTRERSGLQRGFDLFDDDLPSSERNRSNIKERKATATTDRASAWLETNRKNPFFLWVHYIDPHGSYDPPAEHLRAIQNETTPPLSAAIPRRVPLKAADKRVVIRDDKGFRSFVALHNLLPSLKNPTNDTQTYVDHYDSEIHYMDQEVGRLLGKLSDLNLSENTLVIFTADHGESLGEHSLFFEHGYYIYEASSWIPLVISDPRTTTEDGQRVKEQVDILDVYPTIVDWLGVEGPPDLAGQSLLPILGGKPAPEDRISYIEKAEYTFNIRAVRTEGYKLIYNFEVPPSWPMPATRELYDLSIDPDEQENIYDRKDPRIALRRTQLDKLLMDWVRSTGELRSFAGEDQSAIDNLPQSAKDQLEAMGYLDPGANLAQTTAVSPDAGFASNTPPDTDDPEEILLWALTDRPELRSLALHGLARGGKLSTAELSLYIAPAHPSVVRCAAVELLGEIGGSDAIQVIEQALSSHREAGGGAAFSLSCAYALRQLSVKTEDKEITRSLSHWNAAIRASAAWKVGNLKADEFKTELTTLTKDPQGEVRVMALRSLGLLGDDTAVERLQEILRESIRIKVDQLIDPMTACASILAITEVGGSDALRSIVPEIANKKSNLLQYALYEAGAFTNDQSAEAIFDQLPKLATTSKRRLLNVAALRLGKKAVSSLKPVLKDTDPDTRVIAAVHLLGLSN